MSMPAPAAEGAAYRERIGELCRRHLNAGYARMANLMCLPIEQRSEGCYLIDEAGHRYLDAGGYGVFLLGHSHPVVVAAVRSQLERRALASKLLLCGLQAEAAAELAAVCPAPLQYVYFCSSGAEAVEAALKLACMNGCSRVIAAQGGYHGKTLGALSVTGRDKYRQPFARMLSHTEFVPFGDIGALDQALGRTPERCCVVLEPVQAEAGVILPPSGYLRHVADLCRQRDAVLIFDEIQSGMGRTGRWWACQAEEAVPDILLAGKSLSGGCVPVSAMIASAAVFAPFNSHPLIHTSTFAGNPLAMAAVRATLATMQADDIVARASRTGDLLCVRLQSAIDALALGEWVQLRCAGLLIGIEFPEACQAAALVSELLCERVVVCHSLNDHRVVRLTPPALLEAADLDWLADAFERALRKVAESYATASIETL